MISNPEETLPECPLCGKKIQTLYVSITERNLYEFIPQDAEFKDRDKLDDVIDYWICPECHGTLDIAPNQYDAEYFFDGKEYEHRENKDTGDKFTMPLNLWGCREVVHDGEQEYGCEFFVQADSYDDAVEAAWGYILENYCIRGDEAEELKHYTTYQNEYGEIPLDADYRTVEAEVVRQITNLDEVFKFIPTIYKTGKER
jgi:hypothetical protein